MTPSQKYLAKLGLKDPEPIEVDSNGKEISSPTETSSLDEPENPRRSCLKKSALGGIAFGSAFMFSPTEDGIAASTPRDKRYSAPSDRKITDMRYCVTAVMGGRPIIRRETNQGIYGLGEGRAAADERYALMLKSR